MEAGPDLLSWIIKQFSEGVLLYPGIFLVSLLGSLLLFLPAPYFIWIALAAQNPPVDLILLTVASAIGATLAKLLIFRASYAGTRLISPATRRRIRPFQRLVARYGLFAAFFAAATPIPDDIIYVPLGLARYSTRRFLAATFIGKLLITAVVAWGARLAIGPIVGSILGTTTDPALAVAAGVAAVASLVLVVVALLRLDWAGVLGRWFPWTLDEDGGGRAAKA